ncbi:MAG: dienelactone hydrolase family protein [Euryarchaeota archaeon]|nr:dienelactone hydrolase family protein [Euryarchaeota archaeon]
MRIVAVLLVLLLSACLGQSQPPEEARGNVLYGDGYTGYLAEPGQPGKYPGVVMIHEWWGLNDNIRDMADQLSREGYVVLAVDLYGDRVATNPGEARELSSEVSNNSAEALRNLKSAVGFLRSRENVAKDSIASLGWCFGGGWSLQLALSGEDLAATVIYYGRLETDPGKLSAMKGPVLGIFGDQDRSIPIATVEEFRASLDAAGVENEVYVYPGVGHAFANPTGGGYAPEETRDAWGKTLAFLEKRVKRGK